MFQLWELYMSEAEVEVIAPVRKVLRLFSSFLGRHYTQHKELIYDTQHINIDMLRVAFYLLLC
jgi:hypothetical protein